MRGLGHDERSIADLLDRSWVWQHAVVADSDAEASLRPQAKGTLSRGALQNYGLIEVPQLEEQAANLLAEMAGTETR